MRSCDTNILFYACHRGCPEYQVAQRYLQERADDPEFAICELVLIELYVLLRNPKLVDRPLSAAAATDYCQALRSNPSWGIIDYPGDLMDQVWKLSRKRGFSYREIFDARLAVTLLHHGVSEFATRNTSHFERYGFEELTNPFD